MEKYSKPHKQGRGYWLTYDGSNGLADNWVWSIFQDRDGCLWFGTECGVSRFDGVKFVTFTSQNGLAHNSVISIFQDDGGLLWFGTRGGGVSRFDGYNWMTFSTSNGLASNTVNTICQDNDGNIWFGTTDGVSRYDGTRFENVGDHGLAHNHISAILQDSQGNIWFATSEHGVCRFNPSADSEQTAWTKLTSAGGLVHNSVTAIVQGPDQKIWFGTRGGVSWFDGHVWETVDRFSATTRWGVFSMLFDLEGYLWVGYGGDSGMKRYNGEIWESCSTQDGLSNESVFCALQDREGHIWFGTGGGGANRYSGSVLSVYTTAQGLVNNDMQAVRQDDRGVFWFATRGGLSRFDGDVWENFTLEDGLPDSRVNAIEWDRDHNLWFATRNGVGYYDGQTWKILTIDDGLVCDWVWDVHRDRDGQLWFATRDGVSCYDGRRWHNFKVEDGLAHPDVRAVIQDRSGTFWFGTFGGGLSRFDGQTWQTFTAQGVLSYDYITIIFQDRAGNLWFGTRGGGVNCYDGQTWKIFTTKDGLAHNVVVSIYEDLAGHLWFGTFGGVSRYDGQVFQHLTNRDGLPSNSVWDIYQDQHKAYWFATANGLVRFSPSFYVAPEVVMDAVIADQRYEARDALEISSIGGILAFEFHGMSFKTRPDGMIYRYRLCGFEDAWQTIRTRRVEFENVSVGTYQFEIQAIDRDMTYSPLTQVAITVKPDPHVEGLMEALRGESDKKFVGQSNALRRVQAQVADVAKTDVTVLILGETGTGKGLVAQTLHALSNRRNGPFIQVNCGAIPEGLVETELFGHERGAFTGAVARKLGKVELAAGGTLFLDEVGDLAPDAQVKMLRLLEEHQFDRVGGQATLNTDVRVVAATNRDLTQMVDNGQFREDLYFRLYAFPVQVPPLRERREDIPLLASYFLVEMASRLHKRVRYLTSEAQAALMAYDWPGNVRELEHSIQRAVIVCKDEVIRITDLALEIRGGMAAANEDIISLEENERRYIRQVLDKTNWVVGGPNGAAALLDINLSTLRGRMRKLGILRPKKSDI